MTDRDTDPKPGDDKPGATIDLEPERSDIVTSGQDSEPESLPESGSEGAVDAEPATAASPAVAADTPERPEKPDAPPAASIPPPRQPGFTPLLVAGFIGALAAVAIFTAVQVSGVLPGGEDADEALQRAAATEAGITANTERLERMVESSVGVVTALTPYIGYKTAAALAYEALAGGGSVRELVIERGLMEAELVQKVLSPGRLSGVVPATGVITLPPMVPPED